MQKREKKSKFLPFYWFFFVVFLRVLSSLCLGRKRRWQLAAITFSSMLEKKKTMIMCHFFV